MLRPHGCVQPGVPLLAYVVASSLRRVIDFADARIDSHVDLFYREKLRETR